MGDISTWSPVDESNTMAPPNGWPEAQATNTVNNCARAMMGATRRWYDTVTAQLVGMMPRAGGAFTGPVEVPTLHATNSITAAGNVIAGGQVQGALLYSTANIHADTSIVANGNITAVGQVQAGYLYSTGDILAGDRIDAVTIVGNTVYANTTLSAGTSVAAPTITASGTLSGGNISSSTNITASSGTVTAALLTSSGNLFIAGNGEINGTLAVAGTVFATGFVDTNGLFSVVDELKSLIARVGALEETAHAK